MQRLGVILGLVALAGGASAETYVYPSKGQSAEQQSADKYACYEWAKGQTGFDPSQEPAETAAPPPEQMARGGLVRGGMRGATLGAVGGAIGGDAGKGAAIGAATGAMFGGMRRRDQRREEAYQQQQAGQNQAAQYQQKQKAYNQAWSRLHDGKGVHGQLRNFNLAVGCASLVALMLASPSIAADFDGGQNLRCFVSEIQECEPALGCAAVTAAEADVPIFVTIDFKAKKLSGTTPEGRAAESPIHRIVKDGGVIALQGMEHGRAWSVRIDSAGALSTALADAAGAFVLFGTCLPL